MAEYTYLDPREIRRVLTVIYELVNENAERETIVSVLMADYQVSTEYANALIDTVYGLLDMGLDLYRLL